MQGKHLFLSSPFNSSLTLIFQNLNNYWFVLAWLISGRFHINPIFSLFLLKVNIFVNIRWAVVWGVLGPAVYLRGNFPAHSYRFLIKSIFFNVILFILFCFILFIFRPVNIHIVFYFFFHFSDFAVKPGVNHLVVSINFLNS